MAITVVPGTPVGASGGVNVNNINVSAPSLGANDLHVIAVTVNATGGALSTPSGYTLSTNASRTLSNQAGSPSSSSTLYVFWRLGSASAGTVSLTVNPSTTTGRISAVPFTLQGVDSTTTFDGSFANSTTLSAPSRTVTSGDMYLAFYGVREESAAPLGTNGGTITQSGSMTEIGDKSSLLTNGATSVVTEAAYMAVSAGTAAAQAATTNLTAGTGATSRLDGSISVVVNAETVTPTAPGTPVISATPGNTEVTINWVTPIDGGSAITGYTLQRRTYTGGTPGSWSTINSPAAGATSYSDTGRTNGVTYGYQLSATNSVGTSSYSAEATATPTAGSSTGYIAVVMGLTNGPPDHYYPLDSNYTTMDIGEATTKVDWITDPGSGVTGPPTFGSGGGFDCATFNSGDGLRLATNSQDFSVTKTKQITIMIHLTVDNYNLNAPDQYVHYMHKAESGGSVSEYEWAMRYYQDEDGNHGGRPRRHSGYYYNRNGSSPQGSGLGAGSYSQPDLPGSVDGTNMTAVSATNGVAETEPGTEHVIIMQYWTTGTGTSPGGIKIFFNGVNTDTDTMASYGIQPSLSTTLVRLGRNSLHNSWFNGRARRVGFWNRLLTQAEITTLTSTSNRALSEGSKGSTPVATPPTPPLNVTGTRDPETNAAATITWTTPDSDGGSAITSYTVTHDNGGVGSPQVSSPLGATVRSYDISGIPNVNINVEVIATNAEGDSTPGTTVIAPGADLLALGTVSDNFNTVSTLNWQYDTGVTLRNGQLEWDIVDVTPRGVYLHGEMVGESVYFSVSVGSDANVVSCLFVRSSLDPTKQIRIAHVNGALLARVDNGSPDPTPVSRAYVASSDYYWRISDSSGMVSLQTSGDGVNWGTPLRTPFATPSWFTDVEAGVQQYIGSGLS